MKNWLTLDADKNVIMRKHFTPGRSGSRINKIIIHHNAGVLTTEDCYRVWQTRAASAHYQVETSGIIGQLVWDSDTAWHAGNWAANCSSIGIEHANSYGTTAPVTEATLDNGAHLVAALCRFYRLGRPTWGKNLFGHRQFQATNCPGHLMGSQHGEYVARAQAWYDRMTGANTAPANSASGTDWGNIDALARAVIRGDYGNGAERRNRLGARYSAVQARVNQLLAGNAGGASSPSIEELAQAVIRGDYGNGQERRNRLGARYSAVQARVNQLLS